MYIASLQPSSLLHHHFPPETSYAIPPVRHGAAHTPYSATSLPPRYMVQAWLSDNAHQLVSPVTTETYEVVNIDAKRR